MLDCNAKYNRQWKGNAWYESMSPRERDSILFEWALMSKHPEQRHVDRFVDVPQSLRTSYQYGPFDGVVQSISLGQNCVL